MSMPPISRLLSAAVLALSLSFCRAQVPEPVSVSFGSTPATAVYDLTGTYQINQEIVGAGGMRIGLFLVDLPLVQDNLGRLTGSGIIMVVVGNDYIAAHSRSSGRVYGGGGKPTQVALTVRLSGEDSVGGVITPFHITLRYNLVVSPNGLTGTVSGQASFAKLGSGAIAGDSLATVALPGGVDGTWTTHLNIVPLQRISGSADVVLSNERTLQMKLAGSRNPPRLRLSGLNKSQGNSLVLTASLNPDGTVSTLGVSGKILGQSVRQ